MENNKKESKDKDWVRTPPSERGIVTKPELIKMVHKKLNGRYSYETIYWIVQATFRCFPDILKAGYTLMIRDCFTLKPKIRKGREYFTKSKYRFKTEDHCVPHFKAHKLLKDICFDLPINEEKEGV